MEEKITELIDIVDELKEHIVDHDRVDSAIDRLDTISNQLDQLIDLQTKTIKKLENLDSILGYIEMNTSRAKD